MRSPEEVVQLFKDRLRESSPMIEMMRQVRDLVNGDVVVPLPEMDESQKPAVANLIAEAADQTSMRVSSTMPNLLVPPFNPRNERSKQKADLERRALLGYWQENRMKSRIMPRRARYLSTYGQSPVVLRPDFKRGIPTWQVRDPLHTFPSPSEVFDDSEPADCIFAFRKPLSWLKANYPEAYNQLDKGRDPKPDTPIEILEYIDDDCIMLVAVGVRDDWRFGDMLGDHVRGTKCVQLEYLPNRAGMCTVVAPKRITLDKLAGQFNQLIGMYEAQARLMALELIAVEKGIFPDLVLYSKDGNQTPQLVNGTWMDGRTGGINIVKHGLVDVIQAQPGFKTGESMDRLEAAMRQTGAIPAQWGGETPTNIRTGRASEITMSATVDFRIKEYQETLADSMVSELQRAVRIAKGYFGSRPQSMYVASKGVKSQVEFIPNRDFDQESTVVSFPMPGSDANGLVVAVGQRVGLGLMSRETARWLDPLIENPELEGDLVDAEGLREAQKASLQQMAASGGIPPNDLARIEELIVEENLPLYKAVLKTQQEAQERQATPAPADSPAVQPGLAMPGMGAEQPVEAIEEPTPSLFNLQKLLGGLRQPETAAGGAAPQMVA